MKKIINILVFFLCIAVGISYASISPSFPTTFPNAVSGAVIKPTDINTLGSAVQNLDKRAMQTNGTDITFLKSDGSTRNEDTIKITDTSNFIFTSSNGSSTLLSPDGGIRLERPNYGVTDPNTQGYIDFDNDSDGASYGRLKYDASTKLFKMTNTENNAGISINRSLYIGEGNHLGVVLRLKTGNNGTVSCQTFCAGKQWGNWQGGCVAAVAANGASKTCNDTHSGELSCLCANNGINNPSELMALSTYNAGNGGYGYAPSMVYENGKIHAFFCSSPTDPAVWDTIRYVSSSDNGNTWTSPVVKLEVSNNTTERATCDPSVVKVGGYYYMYYSGNKTNVQTVTFVARSTNIEGPYAKYTERGTWEINPTDPKILIMPRTATAENSGWYGAGQQSVVNVNGTLYSWHTDTTGNYPNNTNYPIYFQTTTDPLVWTQGVVTNINAMQSGDVKYDPVNQVFAMYTLENEHRVGSKIMKQTSTDGITWSNKITVCGENCGLNFIHNLGLLGDANGHIYNQTEMVAFGAPTNLRKDCNVLPSDIDSQCWGDWDLYKIDVNEL